MKKIFTVILAITLLGAFIVYGCAAPAPTPAPTPTPAPAPKPVEYKPVELKMWCAWPVTKYAAYPQNEMFRDLVNEYGKRVNLSLKIIGGPEVFGVYEGIESQLAGTYDVACTAPPYYLGKVPESLARMLDQYTPWEDRQRGTFDLMDKFHQKGGLKYLAFTGYPSYFQGYSIFDTPKPDLTGKMIRTAPIYDPMVKALGGTPVTIAAGEVYEALSRGMVHGLYWPNLGIQDFKWDEVLKYYWGQPTPYLVDCGFTINLNKWNSLDKDQQAALAKAGVDIERKIADVWDQRAKKDFETLVTKGKMKQILFSPEDYKYYVKTALDEVWKVILAKAPDAAQFRPLMTK